MSFFVTPPKFAVISGLSRETVLKMVKSGKLPSRKDGAYNKIPVKKALRILEDEAMANMQPSFEAGGSKWREHPILVEAREKAQAKQKAIRAATQMT